MAETNGRKRPFPNSYAVTWGSLYAGEYPGARTAHASSEKVAGLLDAGVTHCIDLTEPQELHPYDELLAELAEPRGLKVVHERLSIPDMDVPGPQRMKEILDAIDESLAAGNVVYVHCWGGIGRTGTVVGCHLVRKGLSGDAALAEVQRLYDTMTMEKRSFQPESPQTSEQKEFVRAWKKAN